jgi:hypothetical protein
VEGVRYFVADTSFYIHHPVKFRDIDLVELTGLDDGPFQLSLFALIPGQTIAWTEVARASAESGCRCGRGATMPGWTRRVR